MTTMTILHPFEAAGLGLAPFRFVGMTQAPRGSGCDYCGTAIVNACWIVSADGKRFKVGTDCVAKTCKETDTTLALDVRKAMDDARYEKAEARRIRELDALLARVQKARADLDAHPWLFADKPHPHAGLAAQGKTLRDYYEWLLKSGRGAGKTQACQAIEKAKT